MATNALPPEVARVAELLGPLRIPWAVAGGWAIDLALGRVTRAHGDVDIAVLRRDQAALREALTGWEFEKVVDGKLVPWPAGESLERPIHEVHGKRDPSSPRVEFLLNEADGDDWVFRRDPRVRRPLARVFRAGPAGLRLLAPEVVLLYKSNAAREVNEADFTVAQELIDHEAHAWLRESIGLREPGHRWVEALAAPPEPHPNDA